MNSIVKVDPKQFCEEISKIPMHIYMDNYIPHGQDLALIQRDLGNFIMVFLSEVRGNTNKEQQTEYFRHIYCLLSTFYTLVAGHQSIEGVFRGGRIPDFTQGGGDFLQADETLQLFIDTVHCKTIRDINIPVTDHFSDERLRTIAHFQQQFFSRMLSLNPKLFKQDYDGNLLNLQKMKLVGSQMCIIRWEKELIAHDGNIPKNLLFPAAQVAGFHCHLLPTYNARNQLFFAPSFGYSYVHILNDENRKVARQFFQHPWIIKGTEAVPFMISDAVQVHALTMYLIKVKRVLPRGYENDRTKTPLTWVLNKYKKHLSDETFFNQIESVISSVIPHFASICFNRRSDRPNQGLYRMVSEDFQPGDVFFQFYSKNKSLVKKILQMYIKSDMIETTIELILKGFISPHLKDKLDEEMQAQQNEAMADEEYDEEEEEVEDEAEDFEDFDPMNGGSQHEGPGAAQAQASGQAQGVNVGGQPGQAAQAQNFQGQPPSQGAAQNVNQ